MAEHVQGSSIFSPPQVTFTFQLGSEAFSVDSKLGNLSQQLAAVKEESMNILKDYITKHNVPTEVPDEPLEPSSEEEEDDKQNNPPKKSKKQK
ncbi:uncharacterized protein LOC110028131 [Phalaenopsis equestris]|uniref:uncharacterized protein LOC110028131 n=1 Tax=Phalaenopsis equestris TaxID=78828 RepID=UPI0009E4E09A|nr:uncharacterized protein LOC110028131 [Phalaenopsis equestris]